VGAAQARITMMVVATLGPRTADPVKAGAARGIFFINITGN
jgi:hypothetical protein